MSDLVERKDEEREAALRCQGDWHPAGDHAVLLRLLNRERARIAELEAERDTATRALGEMRAALEEIDRVASARHVQITAVSDAGLVAVNAILNRLGRVAQAALAKTERK